ncbi:MAG: Mitochondrial distribution and morphology protein 31, mitochondrial precursor [Pycnora praestabilis]|nr:MAG: Mitochondrial distribution and morphology protein 31, mitochondrial precursor [Pycnora praestabilis]
MSGNVGRRIWSQAWTFANPVFAGPASACPRVPFPSTPSHHEAVRTVFSGFRQPPVYTLPPRSSKSVLSKSLASGGCFAISISPSSSVAEVAVPTYTGTLEKAILASGNSKRCSGSPTFNRSVWKRSLHSTSRGRSNKGSKSNSDPATSRNSTKTSKSTYGEDAMNDAGKVDKTSSSASSTFSANKHLLNRLPQMPQIHRPSKEELLAAATGFWSRLRVRFKWFSIRSVRPFNVDEIGAFFSWFVLGHVIWILAGTTTFFSLVILTVNTVFAQGKPTIPKSGDKTLARWVGNYLTKSSGVRVVFESAIVPKWGDGVISFKNVFVSRRPGQGQTNVSKGSRTTAAAAAAAAAAADKTKDSFENRDAGFSSEEEEEDTNYTQFDVSIDTVNVTLSFSKWFNGKGLLRDVDIKGIRGVVDRTSVHYSGEYVDPSTYKHQHSPGDFEINSFKMEDLLLTIHQPHGFRPFSVSIFSCDLPQLRKQWLFYDFLAANMMSGSFDESLFTIHPRQVHGYTGVQLNNGVEANGEASPWKKHSRLRIDGLNIDHLNRGVEGPFSWIHEGNVDIVADLMFPTDNDESIARVMSDFYDRLEATVTSNRYLHLNNNVGATKNDIHNERTSSTTPIHENSKDDDRRFLIMDLRVHLNDVRAAVPLFTRDLSYVNNALIRPIVAYINSKKAFIPVNCRVVKRASEFDGSWTIYDSGLMHDLSAETYEAFAKDVVDDQARMRRFKKVGLWSLHLAIQALFMGMAGNIA